MSAERVSRTGGVPALTVAVERALGARGDTAAAKALLTELRAALSAGEVEAVGQALRRVALPDLDYAGAQSLVRVMRKLRKAHSLPGVPTRVAVLGGFTTSQFAEFLELFLYAAGMAPDIYEADYGVFRQEILDPTSPLHERAPDFLFLAPTWRDLGALPGLGDAAGQVAERVEQEVASWAGLWQRAHDSLGCQVIQDNFAPPAWRLLGNHEQAHAGSMGHFIASVNHGLVAAAPPHVTIHDVDSLSAAAGRRAWGDERFFHHAKLPCAPEYLVDYAHSLASVIAAHRGLAKKCLVLDLDNTLWGGVIGDDGLHGIRLGQGDAESEAFQSVQRYAKQLKERGIILAVCSANEEKNAKEVFEKHDGMVLKLDDISCFVANWESKAQNIAGIAKALNIGVDSLVFMDDDNMQRALVRSMLPEVGVPEMPEDPAAYIATLERYRYFQTVSLAAEDLKRAALYAQNAQRQQSLESAGSIEEFLAGLEMRGSIGPIQPGTLERSTQLIQKTNQFNVTTRRHSPAEVAAIVESPEWVTRTVTLADRFGDNGLISVFLGKREDDALVIDTWLMSCRVLRRRVEHTLLNHVATAARELGLRRLRGEYLPTPKNGLVSELYSRLGFELIERRDDESSTWELVLDDDWTPHTTFIEIDNADGQPS